MWLQNSFNILIGVFKHVGLCTNSQKTKAMMCIPSKIRVSMMEEVNNDYCQAANVYQSFVLNRDLNGVRMPAIFQADEDTKTSLYCPVLVCCGGANTNFTLQ